MGEAWKGPERRGQGERRLHLLLAGKESDRRAMESELFELRVEIGTLRRELENARIVRDAYMAECADLRRELGERNGRK